MEKLNVDSSLQEYWHRVYPNEMLKTIVEKTVKENDSQLYQLIKFKLEQKGYEFENDFDFISFIKNRCSILKLEEYKSYTLKVDGEIVLNWQYNDQIIHETDRTVCFSQTIQFF